MILMAEIRKRWCDLFAAIDLSEEESYPEDQRLTLKWERVEPFAIDDAARKKMYAIGMVDQGRRYARKTSLTDVSWQVAVEFVVRAHSTQDPQEVADRAIAEIIYFMINRFEFDEELADLVDDVIPVADDMFVDRLKNVAEGVVVFTVKFRTNAADIRRAP